MKLLILRYLSGLSALISSGAASAHLLGTHEALSLWNLDLMTLVLLVLVAWCYSRGRKQVRKKEQVSPVLNQKRASYFWMGWGALFIALATPLDAMGEQLFSAHMLQHEIIMLVAAPLLVLSQPSSALLRGSPGFLSTVFGRFASQRSSLAIWKLLVAPLGAWTIHLLGLWGWHIPALFEAGLSDDRIHTLQHISFLLIGLLFWWALFRGQTSRKNGALGVLYLFTTALHASLLGALLTFSPVVWYAFYLDTAPAWGLTALQDQQLGGLIMWMPAGLVYITAAGVILAKTLEDQADNKREGAGIS